MKLPQFTMRRHCVLELAGGLQLLQYFGRHTLLHVLAKITAFQVDGKDDEIIGCLGFILLLLALKRYTGRVDHFPTFSAEARAVRGMVAHCITVTREESIRMSPVYVLVPVVLLAAACLAADGLLAADQEAAAITGTLKYHDKFPSEFVEARNVNVWLPPAYETSANERYAVIYMHDGQNLHDPKTSFLGVDWGVDEALTRLSAAGKIQDAIVVGVWNTPQRVKEYLPAKMIRSQSAEQRESLLRELAKVGMSLDEKDLLSDDYLKFLVQELKPFVDQHYRTKPDRANTFVMGSSAGALISLYYICEYPEVFGGAGCVSTHWPLGDGLMIEYIKDRLPDPKTHKLYFDFGTETLDKGYEPYQTKRDAALAAAGYRHDSNWMTRKFAGADHSERSWRARVHVPLEFLLGKTR